MLRYCYVGLAPQLRLWNISYYKWTLWYPTQQQLTLVSFPSSKPPQVSAPFYIYNQMSSSRPRKICVYCKGIPITSVDLIPVVASPRCSSSPRSSFTFILLAIWIEKKIKISSLIPKGISNNLQKRQRAREVEDDEGSSVQCSTVDTIDEDSKTKSSGG